MLYAFASDERTWKIFDILQSVVYGVQTLVSDGFMVNSFTEDGIAPTFFSTIFLRSIVCVWSGDVSVGYASLYIAHSRLPLVSLGYQTRTEFDSLT